MMTFAQDPRDVANNNKLARRCTKWATAMLPAAASDANVTVLIEDDETFIVCLPAAGETKKLRVAKPVRTVTQDDVRGLMVAWGAELREAAEAEETPPEPKPKAAAEQPAEAAALDAMAAALSLQGEEAGASADAAAAPAAAGEAKQSWASWLMGS